MNKTLKIFLTGIMVAFIFFTYNIDKVNAVSGTLSISGASTVTVGDTVTVTVKATGTKIFYWQFYVTYNSAKLKLTSGSATIQGEADDATSGTSVVTRTLKFKALSSGSAVIKVVRGDADMNIDTNYPPNSISYASASKTISIVDPIPKSTNNNLASLTIDTATITPVFSAAVTNYTTELAAGTTEINVNAAVADAKANIAGIGKVAVVEGVNAVNIVVTAENGTAKTYVITVSVKEFNPITVKIDGKKYTVVRQKGLYTVPESFAETTLTIGKESVLAYSNAKAGTILGLKDTKGAIALYLYNFKTKTYVPFSEITSGGLTLFVYEPEGSVDTPAGYKPTTFKINKTVIHGWQLDSAKDKNFYLVYGMDVENGNKGFYQFDNKDETLQRFYNERTENLQNVVSTYMIVFASMGILILALLGMNIFQLMKFGKLESKIKKARDKHYENRKE